MATFFKILTQKIDKYPSSNMKNQMKVIFIGSSSMGPRYIMSILKKNGHQAFGIYQGVDEYLGEASAGFEPPISLKALISESPKIIGFSIDSSSYRKSIPMAEKIKAAMPETFIIFGGVHPTIFPEEVITNKCVNAICMGEGEYPMLELCNAISDRKDIFHIQNLWIKDENGVVKNPLRPYVQDLDALEMDRDGLYYTGIFSGRRCKGNCSFCNTPAIKRAGSKGKFLRKRSIENVLNEIEAMLKINRKYALSRFFLTITITGSMSEPDIPSNIYTPVLINMRYCRRQIGLQRDGKF
jgi:radical SAM superfamily enzyme YgiQ (UPF0313 family)